MFTLIRDLDVKTEVSRLSSEFREVISSVKGELDEHLDTINQNTSEIQQNYEFLAEIEGKIDKLAERLDAIEMLLLPEKTKKMASARIELTLREQEVFMVIYAGGRVSVHQVAKRLGFSDEMVTEYIQSIISKGIPVLEELHDGCGEFFLDHGFKALQAKQNFLRINEAIAKEVFVK